MRLLASVVVLSGAAFAQSAAPQFAAADVRISPVAHTMGDGARGPFFGDGRYEFRNANMVDLIHVAYGVDPERVFGGPAWIEMDRFDIIAIAPPRSTAE